jgi:hypothetical protein
MLGNNSPIKDAYHHAVYNRVVSMVYCALNGSGSTDYIRKDWKKRGTYQLTQLLLQCARPDWSSHPETFWIAPWIADHLRASDPNRLYYIVDQWLEGQPLPYLVSDDPFVEDAKVKELERLFSALNP